MSRALRLLPAGLMPLVIAAQVFAATASYQFGSVAEARDVFRLRLTDLPAGTDLDVSIKTSHPARFLLLSESDTIAFPDTEAPLFDIFISAATDVSVRISDGGNYFLVVDNTAGDEEVAFGFIIHAESKS